MSGEVSIDTNVAAFDGRLTGKVFEKVMRVYFEDTDATGVVYHANYVRYFERCRTDFIRAIGIHHTELATEDTAFAVVSISLNYKSPARVDDVIRVTAKMTRIKGAVMTIYQEVWRDQSLLCTGQVEVIFIDGRHRPRRPPLRFRQVLDELIDNEVAG